MGESPLTRGSTMKAWPLISGSAGGSEEHDDDERIMAATRRRKRAGFIRSDLREESGSQGRLDLAMQYRNFSPRR